MYEHVLVPYDGSDEARKGAIHGIELAAALGAEVHGLYVSDLPGVPRALSIRDDEDTVRQEYREYGEKVLGDLSEIAEEHGVEFSSNFRTGTTSEEIVDYAESEDMDVIVMGSAYRGKLGNLIGGVTDRVVRSSTVPVISQRMGVDEL